MKKKKILTEEELMCKYSHRIIKAASLRQVIGLQTHKMTHAQTSDLIQIGQRMSNMLYNMKQATDVPLEWRDTGEKLHQLWDKVQLSRP